MAKAVLLLCCLLFVVLASAQCPIAVVSPRAEADGFSLNIRNLGKLPIRRIEFNCTSVATATRKAKSGYCVERNVLFFSNNAYTVKYPYPDVKAETVLVSLKSVTLGDGYIWRPNKNEPCQRLKIR
jgi:hypothetical protein